MKDLQPGNARRSLIALALMVFAFATLFLTPSTAAAPPGPPTSAPALSTLALVGVVGPQKDPAAAKLASSLVALLEQDLSARSDLRLVERKDRDKILRELNYDLAALADPSAPLKVGRMLNADVIIWAQPLASPSNVLLFHIVHAKTGAILGLASTTLTDQGVVNSVPEISRRIVAAARFGKPALVTVAVGLFENSGKFERLRPLAFLLQDSLTEQLAGRPSLLVLQRSAMQPLREELQLLQSGLHADDQQALPPRQATWLLTGSFNEVVGQNPPAVKLHMELVNAATGKKTLEDDAQSPIADVHQVVIRWAARIDQQLGSLPLNQTPPTPDDEAQSLKLKALADLRCCLSYNLAIPGLPPAPHQRLDRSSAGQPLYAALIRQAIERLEVSLFIKPDDVVTKTLLATALAQRGTETWNAPRAVELLRDVYNTDKKTDLGVYALSQIPRILLDVHFEAGMHPKDTRPLLAAIDAYLEVSRELAGRDVNQSMLCAWEAARWSMDPSLKNCDKALEYLRPNVEAALHADPTQRLVAYYPIDYTATQLAAIAKADPAKAAACRDLLTQWSTHASPYLRQIAFMALGRLEQDADNIPQAAKNYALAEQACLGQSDNWFPSRADEARIAAANAYLQAKDYAAGLNVLKPFLAKAAVGERLEERAVLTIGDLYEASGHNDDALALYKTYLAATPLASSSVADRYNKLLKSASPAKAANLVDYKIRQSRFGLLLCPGDGIIWSAGGPEIQCFDPASGKHFSGRLPIKSGIVFHALAWTDHALFVGTSTQGLWKFDAREGPAALDHPERWHRIDKLPDDNITALAVGSDKQLYVGVGVVTTGAGNDVRGGIVQIGFNEKITPLNGENASSLAPDKLAWSQGFLFSKTNSGLFRFDPKANSWIKLSSSPSCSVSPGADHPLLLQSTRPRAFGWLKDAADINSFVSVASGNDLLCSFALESPDCYWLFGRGRGAAETHELMCIDKRSGAILRLDESAGRPFSSVQDAIWFNNQLWLATREGLVTIESVHFPVQLPASKPLPAPAPPH